MESEEKKDVKCKLFVNNNVRKEVVIVRTRVLIYFWSLYFFIYKIEQ